MRADNKASVRVRFAPSPTGHLHIGTARTALFNWLYARHYGGRFILRIEDTDRSRSTVEYESSIMDGLRWLGLVWDEGPDINGDYGPYRQSERRQVYQKYAASLLETNRAYYCYCTPQELEAEREAALAAGRMPMYSGRCRRLTEAERRRLAEERREAVVRFFVQPNEPYEITFKDLIKGEISLSSSVIGDFIIVKTDGLPTYNFAAAIDDLTMSVTRVLRGEDHITNTARQIMIFRTLRETPPIYGHFSMILGSDRAKLSKRHGAVSIIDYRRQGYLPEAIVNYLALLSWSSETGEEIFGLKELIEKFSVERVSKSPAIFDQPKLDWLNGQWIRLLRRESLANLIEPYLKSAGFAAGKEELQNIAEAVRSNLTVLADAPKYAKIFFAEPQPAAMREQFYEEPVRRVLRAALSKLESADKLDIDKAKEILEEAAAELKKEGIKGRAVYHPLRLALTGEDSGPELFLVINALGKEETVNRLKKALDFVL